MHNRLTDFYEPGNSCSFAFGSEQPGAAHQVDEHKHGIQDVDKVQVADRKPTHQLAAHLPSQGQHKHRLQGRDEFSSSFFNP